MIQFQIVMKWAIFMFCNQTGFKVPFFVFFLFFVSLPETDLCLVNEKVEWMLLGPLHSVMGSEQRSLN